MPKAGPKTLIIGAAGAVGKRLSSALSRAGAHVVAADRMQFIPSTVRHVADTAIGNVDVRDAKALRDLFREHADENTTVWNLASPLSVEVGTALSCPTLAPATVSKLALPSVSTAAMRQSSSCCRWKEKPIAAIASRTLLYSSLSETPLIVLHELDAR